MRGDDGHEVDSPRLRRIARSIEERLAELAAAGELAGLPGEGGPLADDGGALAGDRWAAQHVMANERIVPAWVELARDIEAWGERLARRVAAHREWLGGRAALVDRLPAERILDAVRTTREVDARFREEIGLEVASLNGRIARFNAVVPVASLHRFPLVLERVLDPDR